MKLFFSIVLIQFSLLAFSSEKGILIPEVTLVSSEKSESLISNESLFIFQFKGFIDNVSDRTVLYSIDGVNNSKNLDVHNEFRIQTTPGIHSFQFFYNDLYYEIYADSLNIKEQFVDTYAIRFESSEFPVVVDKPVIYLYPESEIDFSLTIRPKGKLAFTYPFYNEAWKGSALPNGDITIENETFNYLFWEADQTLSLNIISPEKGAVINREETIRFLEKQLNAFGFNSKEKADFITFWGPQLVQNEFNYIYFVLNEEAINFAELVVNPEPDNVFRFYILTCPVANPMDYHYLEPQLIESIKREGFTLLEWGGSVIDVNYLKKRLQYL